MLPYSAIYRRDEVDAFLEQYPIDFLRAELSPTAAAERENQVAKPGTYVDEWGSEWRTAVPGTIGEVCRPAIEDWSDLDRFSPPWQFVERSSLDYFNRCCEQSDLFTLPPVSARPFERIQFIRGTENVYLDLATGEPAFSELLRLVHEYYLAEVEMWASSKADGVFLMDDWGTQDSMLISPSMWRETFKPLYREYCDIIHGAGKFAFFHSDGFIEPIFGDLIEVGMDAINSQLFCMDIESLGSAFRGKVAFWGEIDRQYVLPFGSRQEVEAAVARVRRALDSRSGGVIAQCEWGKDNEVENISAVFDAWA